MQKIADPARRQLAAHFLERFERQAVPLFPQLRQSVTYNDANDYNVLVSHDTLNPAVPGVIDFGDAVFTHTINELAIAAAYAAMHKPDPLAAMALLVKGCHRVFPLTEAEAEILFSLVGARLLISVVCSAINLAENPDNQYLRISDQAAWDLMRKLDEIPPALAHATFRHACGWEPCPANAAFVDWARGNASRMHPVVPGDLSKAVWLDLSVGSAELGNYADIEDADVLHRHIYAVHGERPGIGRYDEVRPFYTSDAYEVRGNEGPQWRTVHIGLDIFLPPGTPVFAPLEGRVHSFQDNAQDRDYGPTIILEHQVDEKLRFYTLYGHLTRTSLNGLSVGQSIAAGQAFCQIGPMPENGNWSPHLHFQVMLDLLGKSGDYPGVAFPDTRAVWKSLCPDPWLLLTGRFSEPKEEASLAETLHYRREHLGRNLSVSYQKPLKMLRGWRQYLFDHTGRRYLDTVNNVAHAGHEHPRVVRAGQRQMAVLNTNTRYLHDNLRQFSEALLATFPPGLDVVFLVNSGSEANELALRLARTHTRRKDTIVVDVGYHGNTGNLIEISSYKFDGPGGAGAPAHVHKVAMPDVYRGPYKQADPQAGEKYAQYVAEAIEQIQERDQQVGAFICESILSCGGQIVLPPGYLPAVYQYVRAVGGVCIADEVQVGFGRVGTHFWAFETQGVVPDIVTLGKPIGNGHPLAAVITTPEIAASFDNGMEYFNTFGGSPVSCAIGMAVLDVIAEEGLQANALAVGERLLVGLRGLMERHPLIGDVRGLGLFVGIELVLDRQTLEPAGAEASYIANRMRDHGILVSTDGPYHNVLKIKPPLVFNAENADFFVATLDKIMAENFVRSEKV